MRLQLKLAQALLWLYVCITVELAFTDRSEAFIGYSEDNNCLDKHETCQQWSKKGECGLNPYFMRKECAKSCSVCGSKKAKKAWAGFATEIGTRTYTASLPGRRKIGHGHFKKDISMGSYDAPGQRLRGSPWLTLGSLGTGTYLGDEDAATDFSVTCGIILSVFSGMNVIDTASNYRGGRAQEAVGDAIRAFQAVPEIRRDMLFFSTKAGFVAPRHLQSLKAAGRIQEGDVLGGVSCIHPACLEVSLADSLLAMNLETVDLLYLHNAAEMANDRPAFWKQLEAALVWLEEARAKGLIRAYGMATWSCFREPPGAAGHIRLQQVVHLARKVGGLHHGFRYIQLPINVGMLEAVRKKWQVVHDDSGGLRSLTLLEAAAELGVGVFASGPLGEGGLLSDLAIKERVEATGMMAGSLAGQYLQVVRSTPLLVGTVVGHKQKEHVIQNLVLVAEPVLDALDHKRLLDRLEA